MATVQELEVKVENARDKVEKCRATIARHNKQLEKKIATGAEQWEIKTKQEDIKGAEKKLKEAEQILENWIAKLDLEIEKERFIEGNAPTVIKEFVEQWKQLAYEWHIKKHADYVELKMRLRKEEQEARIEFVTANKDLYASYFEGDKIKEYWMKDLVNVYPKKPMEDFLKEKKLEYMQIRKRLNAFAGAVVLTMDTYRNEAERLEWLDKLLEADKKAKLIDLVTRVNSITGTITDAQYLRVDEKGNLNGYVTGEKGIAEVQTIGAGGWNIQCFHYRTLVHKKG